MMLPWAGGLEGIENGSLIFAFIASALYFLRPKTAGGLKWAIIKTVPVALFAVIAYRLHAPWLLVACFALSALGDFFLAFDGEKAFLGGLSSFFAAHVAYIALFVTGDFGMVWDFSRIVLAVSLFIHAVMMGRKLARAVPATLKVPVIAYVSVISIMGLAAAAFGSLIVLAGALFFALSDTLLAVRNFLIDETDPRRSILDGGVWITYILAQALILFGYTV